MHVGADEACSQARQLEHVLPVAKLRHLFRAPRLIEFEPEGVDAHYVSGCAGLVYGFGGLFKCFVGAKAFVHIPRTTRHLLHGLAPPAMAICCTIRLSARFSTYKA